MRSLRHVNILRVHEVFSSTSSIYLVMDVHTGGVKILLIFHCNIYVFFFKKKTLEDKIKEKEIISSSNVK